MPSFCLGAGIIINYYIKMCLRELSEMRVLFEGGLIRGNTVVGKYKSQPAENFLGQDCQT